MIDAKRDSKALESIAPGTREPSVKNMVGVPVTLSLRPSSTTLSVDAVALHDSAPAAGVLPLSIQSSQVFDLSAEHQTFFTLVRESSLRMGYMKVYTVMSLVSAKVLRKRLQ